MSDIERAVVAAYERSRLERAAAMASVVLLSSLPFAYFAPFRSLGVGLLLLLFGAGVFSLWRGLEWERGWWHGLAAGIIPLMAASIARPFGHGCSIGGECYSWCMPACAAGGFTAAILVSHWAKSSERPLLFGVVAGATTIATGALGCSCLSLSGALALCAAYVLSATPTLFVLRRTY